MLLIDMRGRTLTRARSSGGGRERCGVVRSVGWWGCQRITTATGNRLIDTSALGARWRSESWDGGGEEGLGSGRGGEGEPDAEWGLNSRFSPFFETFIGMIAHETQFGVSELSLKTNRLHNIAKYS